MCPSTIDEEPSLESAPPMSWAKSMNSQYLIFSTKRIGIGGMPSDTTREGPPASCGGSRTVDRGGPRAVSNGSVGRSGPALLPSQQIKQLR